MNRRHSLTESKRMNRRFTLSRTNRKLLGVCGGMADYFDVDPTLVRIGWVVGTLFLGAPIIIYPLIALIVD